MRGGLLSSAIALAMAACSSFGATPTNDAPKPSADSGAPDAHAPDAHPPIADAGDDARDPSTPALLQSNQKGIPGTNVGRSLDVDFPHPLTAGSTVIVVAGASGDAPVVQVGGTDFGFVKSQAFHVGTYAFIGPSDHAATQTVHVEWPSGNEPADLAVQIFEWQNIGAYDKGTIVKGDDGVITSDPLDGDPGYSVVIAAISAQSRLVGSPKGGFTEVGERLGADYVWLGTAWTVNDHREVYQLTWDQETTTGEGWAAIILAFKR